LADHVIKVQTLQPETTKHAIMLMAVIIPIQWAVNLRLGALMGLERQVLVNVLRVIMATVATVGAVLVLWLVSPTVTAFFWWQLIAAFLHLSVIVLLLGRILPLTISKARFNIAILQRIRSFATGMLGINMVGIFVTQLDKWVLVTLLPLQIFGYYVLAVAVSNSLYVFITPIFNAFFPRFSIMVAKGESEELKRLYHLGTQVMATAVIPAAVVLSLFSHEVLLLWTSNPEIAVASAPLVSILVIGVALNGLMNIPYALQLAYGWTRLILGINLVAMAFFVPAIPVLTLQIGAAGAAIAWLAFNVIFAALAVPLTHRRILMGGKHDRVMLDVIFSGSVAIIVLCLMRIALPLEMPNLAQTLYIILSYIIGVLTLGFCGSQTREWILRYYKKHI
jgi:O-antigen/teichoic acid export membrane protein